jgi:hypothetical protein
MSAPWARDGEPDLACALALVGREALGANRDGRTHITTSRVIVTWNHIEIGIGGEASVARRRQNDVGLIDDAPGERRKIGGKDGPRAQERD